MVYVQDKEQVNAGNKYNHNFNGVYCTCNRPYPDSEDEVSEDVCVYLCWMNVLRCVHRWRMR